MTERDLVDALRESESVHIVGAGTKSSFCPPSGNPVSTLGLTGIVEWSPEDLVVVVRAGTAISQLQEELASRRQWIPLPATNTPLKRLTAGLPGTVGGLVSAGLPTRSDSWSKGVRYWVLGLKVIRSDGTVVKCGSKAVKNVAGYDVQKLFIGAWGTLGLITEVILRVSPIPNRPILEDIVSDGIWNGDPPLTIARAPLAESDGYARSLGVPFALDRAAGTVWALGIHEAPADGWAIRTDGEFSMQPPPNPLCRVLKKKLDPQNKFNPAMRLYEQPVR